MQRTLARLGVIAVCLFATVGVATATPAPNQRVDLRTLLLGANGDEPGLLAWQQELRRQGAAFDTILTNQSAPITADTLAVGTTRAKYQLVIVADDLVPLTLDPAERAALQSFEAAFGIRQIDAFVFPSAEEGLVYSGQAGTLRDLGTEATLTPEGRTVFPYLSGRMTFDGGAYGFGAVPAAGANVVTLVPDSAGSTLLGVVTWPDGRQEMVSTVSVGPNMIHGSLLLRGMLAWGTEQIGLGQWRSYYAAHIDDIFLGDDRWDTVANVTHEDDGATIPTIRMTPADVTRAASWSVANGLKLDFAFNGAGSDEAVAANGSDPLTTSLVASRSAFRWINHTYSHLNLNTATQTEIQQEITENRKFAKRLGLSVRNNELVTGEHSGLGSYFGILSTGTPLNPALAPALNNTGIKWLADDASAKPAQRSIGAALTVPRHPSNVYYNVGTRAEQLDEYNYIYFENCTATATTTCLTQPATWEQYINSEASIMLGHVLGNDPRPHYMHQGNLAEDGTFYPVVDEVLNRYRSYFTTPLVNPTTTEAGAELQRQAGWASALSDGRVSAYRLGSSVYVTVSGASPVDVPVTGAAGDSYGGLRSRWVTLKPGSTHALKINTTV
jgi:hypothetical protein